MARLPYPDPEALEAKTRETLERLPLSLNVFRMMAHAETNFRPLLGLGTSILTEQKLDAKLRELVILRVAQMSGCEYEWTQHAALAKGVGCTDDEIDALGEGRIQGAPFDDGSEALLAFATDVVRHVRAADDTLEAVRRHFSNREIVETVLAIGYYMGLARLLETTGVDLDEAAGDRLLAERQGSGSAD